MKGNNTIQEMDNNCSSQIADETVTVTGMGQER